MKHKPVYKIPYKGLKEGKHAFHFAAGKELFELFEAEDVFSSTVNADVQLIKSSLHLELRFHITGEIELICDRCLDHYMQLLDSEANLYVKYGEKREEESSEVLILTLEDFELDVAQYIYEFTMLGLPLKKQHPIDKKGHSQCDPEMIRLLEQMQAKSVMVQDIDPRWNKLKNIN